MSSGDPLELARGSLSQLRQARDWNELTPVQVHVNIPPAAKRSASPAPAPAPAPVRSSMPAGKLQGILQLAGSALQRIPPWGIVIVAVVAIAAWAYLAVHGRAPIP